MDSLFIPMLVVVVALIALVKRGVDLSQIFGARGKAFRTAAAGKYSNLATIAVIAILVLIMLDPESRLFFMLIDAVGFDLIVALFALQFRSVLAGLLQYRYVPLGYASRLYLRIPGAEPITKLRITVAVAAAVYIGVSILLIRSPQSPGG